MGDCTHLEHSRLLIFIVDLGYLRRTKFTNTIRNYQEYGTLSDIIIQI